MRVARVARAVNVQIPVLDHFAISESKLCIWIRTFAFQTFKHIVTNAVFYISQSDEKVTFSVLFCIPYCSNYTNGIDILYLYSYLQELGRR